MAVDSGASSLRGGGLLARFAEFYEEVAQVHRAIRDGQLASYLADGKTAVEISDSALAAMVSQRLKSRLQEQARQIAAAGTQAEIDAYRIAQYAMAALADELFILDIEWSAGDAWQQCLLEQGLFESNSAGRDLFQYLDDLLATRARSPLHEELAAVFLMSLRLGFQGQHRGSHGLSRLRGYATRLIRFIGTRQGAHQPGFLQAYQHRIAGTADERIAPLARWYKLGALALAIYVAISTTVWIVLTNRFTDALSGS